MVVEKTELKGVSIINNFNVTDNRGLYEKTFNKNTFLNNNIVFDIRESYYSVSKKNVIRGMHFQLPPHDHEKLVFVPSGEIMDVVVDLRKQSPTYKKHFSIKLSAKNKKALFIPKGFAHGFKSLSNNTITVYNVATEYNKDSDTGIKYDSLGFDWGQQDFILSKRDNNFCNLEEFCINNPFN